MRSVGRRRCSARLLADGAEVERAGLFAKAQTGDRLHHVARGRRHVDKHERLRVGAERALQQARQLRVAVRHVAAALADGADDVAERRERLVDRLRLLGKWCK